MSISGNPNILLIIADDLGQDVVNIAGSGANRRMQVVTNDGADDIVGELPNVSLILRNGLYFKQAWAQPACSPTRASIYTGLHPWKNGVGSPTNNPKLGKDRSFATIPDLLPSEYACGLFGKWHLGLEAGTRPDDHGWTKHVGTLDGVVKDYYEWIKYDSDNYDKPTRSYMYATREIVDEAMSWISGLDEETPWFTTIAFHSPHDPFQVPPDGYTTPAAGDPASDDYVFNLMAQNMDYHVGRLIGSVAPQVLPISRDQLENTLIIFMGDNGSHWSIAIEEAKTTIYEGGVRVPMIIADGRAVAQEMNLEPVTPAFLDPGKLNKTSHHLTHVVDLYQTILQTADPDASLPKGEDSRSLISFFTNPGDQPPVRKYNFSQWFTGGQKRATIRNSDYKLNYDAANSPEYELYAYSGGEVPGIEADTATPLYADATSGSNPPALAALEELLDELIANYQANESIPFPDPRPF